MGLSDVQNFYAIEDFVLGNEGYFTINSTQKSYYKGEFSGLDP